MRYSLLFFLLLMTFHVTQASPKDGHHTLQEEVSAEKTERLHTVSPKEKKFDLKDVKTQTIIAFGASLLGILLVLLPYVSLLGLALGLGGLILGWMVRKKVEKKRWARLAIILGALCLLVFIATLVLVIFV